jgi:hypothetical protein
MALFGWFTRAVSHESGTLVAELRDRVAWDSVAWVEAQRTATLKVPECVQTLVESAQGSTGLWMHG